MANTNPDIDQRVALDWSPVQPDLVIGSEHHSNAALNIAARFSRLDEESKS